MKLGGDAFNDSVTANKILASFYKGRERAQLAENVLMGMIGIKDDENPAGASQQRFYLSQRISRGAATFDEHKAF